MVDCSAGRCSKKMGGGILFSTIGRKLHIFYYLLFIIYYL